MDKTVAYTLSALTHPLFMPSYLFGVLLYQTDLLLVGNVSKWIVLSIIVLCTCLIPFTILAFLYVFKIIDNFHLPTQKERLIPFISVAFAYALSTFLLNRLQDLTLIDVKIVFIVFCITISSYLLALITYFWKVSAHALGLGGVLGILFVFAFKTSDTVLLYPLVIFSILAGAVMTARLALSAHQAREVWGGTAIGIATNAILLYLLWI